MPQPMRGIKTLAALGGEKGPESELEHKIDMLAKKAHLDDYLVYASGIVFWLINVNR